MPTVERDPRSFLVRLTVHEPMPYFELPAVVVQEGTGCFLIPLEPLSVWPRRICIN